MSSKALCFELDKLGLKPLPRRSGSINVVKGDQVLTVILRPTQPDGSGNYWFWVWDGDRLDGGRDIDRAVKMGEEADMARRIFNVLDIPAMEDVSA